MSPVVQKMHAPAENPFGHVVQPDESIKARTVNIMFNSQVCVIRLQGW